MCQLDKIIVMESFYYLLSVFILWCGLGCSVINNKQSKSKSKIVNKTRFCTNKWKTFVNEWNQKNSTIPVQFQNEYKIKQTCSLLSWPSWFTSYHLIIQSCALAIILKGKHQHRPKYGYCFIGIVFIRQLRNNLLIKILTKKITLMRKWWLRHVLDKKQTLHNLDWVKGNVARINWLYDVTYLVGGCVTSYNLLRNTTNNSATYYNTSFTA